MSIRIFTITFNLLAASVLMIGEIFRPGFVSGAVNLGWVWFGTGLLLIVGYWLVERSGSSQR